MHLNKLYSSFFSVVCGGTLLGLLFFLWGCVSDEYPPGNDTRMGVLRFALSTDIPHDVSTRSVNENAINDLHLLVYDASHKLLKKVYYSSPMASSTDLTLLIRAGSGYTVYGIANTGNSSLFANVSAVDTEDELKAFTTVLSSWDGIGNGSYLLLSGSVANVTVSASSSNLSAPSSTCSLPLKRLAAKVTLNVGIASGSGVTVSGYCIYGLPKKSCYVAHPLTTEENADGIDTQTNRAVDASLPTNGADWTNSGLVSLSNVTSFNTSFYMYENRPGVNTSITLQNQKIKANVPATPADSAAYVMIYGKAPGYSSLSWKIYLGGNNTGNFNMKRNCQYTYNITLKPNDSDTRITYKKSGTVWAGSNIYWNGTKLTFDAAPVDPSNLTTQELTNMKKQGVFFLWGSLIGVSPNGAHGDGYSASVLLYIPPSGGSYNSGGSWITKTGNDISYASIPYITDDGSPYGQTSTYLNDAGQNTSTTYAAYKGDICQYLSKTNAVSGSWRMPTAKELNAGGVADNGYVAWTGSTAPWASFGGFGAESGNVQGTTQFSSGGIYTVNGSSSRFPASGYRYYSTGTLLYVGQFGYCWSSSAYSGTFGFYLGFLSSYVYPAHYNYRQYGFPVRCVQN